MKSGKRVLFVAAGILTLTWVVAGVVNLDSAWWGANPPVAGRLATFVAVCAWPVVGWWVASQPGTGFIRFASVFWLTVAAGAPLVVWALDLAGESGWAALVVGVPLGVPLYGLSEALPSWGQPMAQIVVIGVATLAMTLASHLARRRIGRHSAHADPV
jgi:hypothetical protein